MHFWGSLLYLDLREKFDNIKAIIRSSYSKEIKIQWPKTNMIGETNQYYLLLQTDIGTYITKSLLKHFSYNHVYTLMADYSFRRQNSSPKAFRSFNSNTFYVSIDKLDNHQAEHRLILRKLN